MTAPRPSRPRVDVGPFAVVLDDATAARLHVVLALVVDRLPAGATATQGDRRRAAAVAAFRDVVRGPREQSKEHGVTRPEPGVVVVRLATAQHVAAAFDWLTERERGQLVTSHREAVATFRRKVAGPARRAVPVDAPEAVAAGLSGHDFVPVAVAADALGVSREYVRRLCRRDALGAHRAGGDVGRWLVPVAELRAAVRRRAG